jgi:hypothetical protein
MDDGSRNEAGYAKRGTSASARSIGIRKVENSGFSRSAFEPVNRFGESNAQKAARKPFTKIRDYERGFFCFFQKVRRYVQRRFSAPQSEQKPAQCLFTP